MDYPVAEIFNSPQGEGAWAGVAMTFVRLAGCNVGKPYPTEERINSPELMTLPIWADKCTAWNGTEFTCDTNYKMMRRMTIEDILLTPNIRKRICLTGGEPLMHYVQPFLQAAWERHHIVHIETSGTKPLKAIAENVGIHKLWICVSPKGGYIPSELIYANEIKVLVGPDFDEATFLYRFGDYINDEMVSISPINGIKQFDAANAKMCLEMQRKHPQLRISMQMHKMLGCS